MSSIIYNGHEIQDLIVNGNQAQLWLNGQKLYPSGGTPVDPYNPLGLPPFTIRAKFSSGYTPTMGDSQTLVDASENVWDITKNSTDWSNLFADTVGWDANTDLIAVIGANTTGVTSMWAMFYCCPSLTSVPLFDTSSCKNMSRMFAQGSLTYIPHFDTSSCENMSYMFTICDYLTTVPLFDTSSCIDMSGMFSDCYNVQSGALALYQQASTQSTPPSYYYDCFTNCGSNTVTGAAELAQIPSSWGGTGD